MNLKDYLCQKETNFKLRLAALHGAALANYRFVEYGKLVLNNINPDDASKYSSEIEELKRLIGVREARI